jgi:hypothetical protein
MAGRKAFVPTDEQRARVRSMASAGIDEGTSGNGRNGGATLAEICAVIDVSEKTLRRAFKTELKTAFYLAKDQMRRSLFQQGTGQQERPEERDERGRVIRPRQRYVPPNPTATIAWLEFYGGAVKTQRTEHTGQVNTRNLTDEQRDARIAELLRKAGAA